MNDFNMTRIDRLRYRPTKVAEDFVRTLQQTVMPGDKNHVVRLAIARSISSGAEVDPKIVQDADFGIGIEGVHLFGEDADLWACILAETSPRHAKTSASFRALVEAHIHHGAQLLKDDYKDVRDSDVEFVIRLAGMLPRGGRAGAGAVASGIPEVNGPVRLKFGSVGTDQVSGDPVYFVPNAPGISPHIAIMGKTRSGKSRTGLEVAADIVSQADLPIVLIDPKGEFVKNGELLAKPEWGGQTLEKFFPGIRPLDVPITPVPLDFLWRPPGVSAHEQAQLAIAFKDSFQKCIKAKGDVALDLLRDAVLHLIRTQRTPISLEDVLNRYREAAEEEGRTAGSIAAKLSEITSLNMIRPTSSPEEFFSKRWVISFGSASTDPKKLAMFLLLDALNSFLMSLPDAQVDEGGHRALRHLLVVDEAREILSYKHGALSSLVRKSASKGGLTMSLSQGPDDFDQEEDDFLEQMGTVGVFALSASSVKSLTGTFGKKRAEDFSDRALVPGVAAVKLPGQAPRKIKAWQ